MDDLLILLIEVDTRWVLRQQFCDTFLNQLLNILQYQVLLFALGKLLPQEFEVNAANIETCWAIIMSPCWINLQVLIHNIVDSYAQVCDISMLAFLLQLLIDSFEGIFLLFHLLRDILTIQIFPEFQECSNISNECLASLYRLTHRIRCFQQIIQFNEVLSTYQNIQIEVMLFQIIRSSCNSFQYLFDEFFLFYGRHFTTITTWICRIVCQSLTQSFYDADIVNHQAVRFAFCHTVGSRNGLHQRMGFHGFVDVET